MYYIYNTYLFYLLFGLTTSVHNTRFIELYLVHYNITIRIVFPQSPSKGLIMGHTIIFLHNKLNQPMTQFTIHFETIHNTLLN